MGQGQAGAVLLTHSRVPKRHRRFDVYLCMTVCTYHMLVFNLWVGTCTVPTLPQAQMSSSGRSDSPSFLQGVLDRGLLCLEVSKSSFLDLSGRAESWLQRSPLLSPEAQESTVPKRLPLCPGSRASLPCPLCLLEPAASCLVSHMLPAPES